LWTALLLSGGMAGLAGGLEVAGPLGQLTPHVPAGYGFAAIIVAFVGRLHPVGIVFSAILMSMFYIGGELAQSRLGLPQSLTGVFQGLLLFALLACDTLIAYRVRWKRPPAKPEILRSAQDDSSGTGILSGASDLVPHPGQPIQGAKP
jgi:simple sugar transport system permease protein